MYLGSALRERHCELLFGGTFLYSVQTHLVKTVQWKPLENYLQAIISLKPMLEEKV